MPGDRETVVSAINEAAGPEYFPRWAQACPKSFGELKQAILFAAVELAKLENIGPRQRARIGDIFGHVAATCFAAGRASVEEGRNNGLGKIT